MGYNLQKSGRFFTIWAIREAHYSVYLELTEYCKPTILQLKNKKMQFQGSKFEKIIKFSSFIKTFLNETALFICGVMWRWWLVRFGATAMICSKVPVVLPNAALHHHHRHQHNVKGIIITIMKIVLTSQICPNIVSTNHTWQNTEEHLQQLKI